MKPIFLRGENFKCFGKFEIDFSEFETVVITGLNGSGKSSFFDIFEFVLFGKSSSNLDKIIRHDTNVCEVEYQFEIDSEIYQIIRKRFRKGNRGEVFLNKKNGDLWVDLSQQRQSEADLIIPQILGFRYKTFKTLVLFSQKESERENLITSSKRDGSDRRELFKDAFDLNIYSKLSKYAQDSFLKKTKNDIESITDNIKKLNFSENCIISLRENLKKIEEQLDTENKNKLDLDNKLSFLKKELLQISNIFKLELELKNNKIIEKNKSLSLLIDNIKQLSTKLDNKISKSKEIDLKISSSNQELTLLKSEINQLSTKNLDNDIQKLENYKKSETEFKVKICLLEQDLHKCRIPLSEGEFCLYCRQSLAFNKTELQIEIDKKEQELISNINLEKNKLKDLLREINKIEISKQRTLESNNKLLKGQLKIENLNSSLLSFQERREEIEKEINLSKEELELKTNQQNILKNEIDQLKLDIAQISSKDLIKKENELNQLISELETEISNIDNIINNLFQNLGTIKEKILTEENNYIKFISLNNELKEVNKLYKIRELIIKSFNEIPSLIINSFLNELQFNFKSKLSEYLPEIEVEFIIDYLKSSSEPVWKDIIYKHNGKIVDLSVGQEFKASLAVREAFIELMNNKLQHTIGLRLFDEVDAYIDQPGRETFVKMLKSIQKKSKVLVISHNDYVQNKFQSRLEIEINHKNGNTIKLCSNSL